MMAVMRIAANRSQWVSAGLIWLTTLIVAVVVLVVHGDRAVWTDEAWVVDYARSATLAEGLGRAIADAQPVAPGYIALVRAINPGITDNPLALRVMTMIWFLGGAVAWWLLATEWSGRPAWAAAGVTLLLFHPAVQRYATEIKQYMPAAAVTIGLIAATAYWMRHWSVRAAAIWLVLALIAVTCTFFGLFAVAGTGGVCLIRTLFARNRKHLLLIGTFGAFVAIVFVALHVLFIRHVSGDAKLNHTWAEAYLSLDRSTINYAWHVFPGWLSKLTRYYPSAPWGLLPPVAAVGWLIWLRRQPIGALCVAATVAVVFSASLAGKWPLGFRINVGLYMMAWMCLWCVPMGLAGAAEQAVRWYRSRTAEHTAQPAGPSGARWTRSGLAIGSVVVALGGAVVTVYEAPGLDLERARVHELIDEAAIRLEPGDAIVMDPAARIEFALNPRGGPINIVPGPLPTDPDLVNRACLAPYT